MPFTPFTSPQAVGAIYRAMPLFLFPHKKFLINRLISHSLERLHLQFLFKKKLMLIVG